MTKPLEMMDLIDRAYRLTDQQYEAFRKIENLAQKVAFEGAEPQVLEFAMGPSGQKVRITLEKASEEQATTIVKQANYEQRPRTSFEDICGVDETPL